jgi:hypothetical protein
MAMKGRNPIEITTETGQLQFSLGAMAVILDRPSDDMNYLARRHYIKASGAPVPSRGKFGGRGGRFWYTLMDLYRAALAQQLSNDGLNRALINMILPEVTDNDFHNAKSTYVLIERAPVTEINRIHVTTHPERFDPFYKLHLNHVVARVLFNYMTKIGSPK